MVFVAGAELSHLLECFPENGLNQSLHAPVLVGLLILTFFREALGWGYAGLVVPGYLATVMLAAPLTGGLVGFESIVTYLLAAIVGAWLPRTQAWSSLFGRERFLLLIVAALLVRLATEGFWLPWVLSRYDIPHSRELYSLGLVLVPLLANSFWNHGLRVALPRVALITALTYVFLDRVLLGVTNFTLSRFQIANESVSLAFLETPHAHIILLLGAAMAARDNVRYGWDYNGILVPALLAVAWYQPTKLVTTIVEAVAILVLARGMARVWPLSQILMVGSRRMLLVYLVGFILKWILGFAVMRLYPGLQMVDYLGFGYLLPSLLAVKMWNTDKIGRVIAPTVQVSLSAFLVGNLTAFVLRIVDPADSHNASLEVRSRESAGLELMLRDTAPDPRPERMFRGRRGAYEEGLAIAESVGGLPSGAKGLSGHRRGNLNVSRTRDGWWVVGPLAADPNDDRVSPRFAMRPRAASKSWMVVVDASRPGAPQIVVGLRVAELLKARLLMLRSRYDTQRSFDDVFRKQLAARHSIERILRVVERHGSPELSVVGRVPTDFPLDKVVSSLGVSVNVKWRASSGNRDGWTDMPILELSRSNLEQAATRLWGRPRPDAWPGSIHAELHQRKRQLTEIEAGAFRPATVEELRLFGDALSQPLASAAFQRPSEWQIALAAKLGYRFAEIGARKGAPGEGWALFEPPGTGRRGLPTWVVRTPGPNAGTTMVEIPAPRWESGGFGSALAIADALRVRGLLVSGALPNVDRRGRADPRRFTGRESFYQRIHESWMQAGGHAVAIHGIAPDREERSDAVITFQDPTETALDGPQWTRELTQMLIAAGLRVDAVDGSVEREPYAGEGDPTMAYARRFAPGRMALLWLSAPIREWFLSLERTDRTAARLERAGYAVNDGTIVERVATLTACAGGATQPGCAGLRQRQPCDPQKVLDAFDRYRDSRNPYELRAGLALTRGCHLEVVRDRSTTRIWAAIVAPSGVWLVPLGAGRRPPGVPAVLELSDVDRALRLGLSTVRVRLPQ